MATTKLISLSPLKFYNDVKKQNRYRSFAYGNIAPLITNPNVVTPFCINLGPAYAGHSHSIKSVQVFDANTKSSVEIVDLAGNKSSINYEVKRIDKIAPTITLNGNATENVTLNESYTDAGITISDNVDKVADLKTTVTITWDSQTGTVETVDAVDTSAVRESTGTLAANFLSSEVI